MFADVEAARAMTQKHVFPSASVQLHEAERQLEGMIEQGVDSEAEYQTFFEANPWIFGAQYTVIQPHHALDDKNIPDFTGVRLKDGARDIIEIKQPFLQLFRADQEFRAEFSQSWEQVEKYLDFARRESGYLHREKGLRFENPQCLLVAGIDLDNAQRQELQRKERMNPAITILTYNDVLALATGTVKFFTNLADIGKQASQLPIGEP